jgi:hypothetical protein
MNQNRQMLFVFSVVNRGLELLAEADDIALAFVVEVALVLEATDNPLVVLDAALRTGPLALADSK